MSEEGFLHIVMLSTAFPHLLLKSFSGEEFLQQRNTGTAFSCQFPPVLQGMELLELLGLLEHGANRARGSRETLSGSGAQTKSLSPKKSDIWSLGFVGT